MPPFCQIRIIFSSLEVVYPIRMTQLQWDGKFQLNKLSAKVLKWLRYGSLPRPYCQRCVDLGLLLCQFLHSAPVLTQFKHRDNDIIPTLGVGRLAGPLSDQLWQHLKNYCFGEREFSTDF